MRLQRFFELVLLLLGCFNFTLASLIEWQVSVQPSRFGMATTTEGHLSAINLRMGDLAQTIWAGNMKIFGGLCLVAAAVLYAARMRAADKAAPPPRGEKGPG
jgi:hypothetical protein